MRHHCHQGKLYLESQNSPQAALIYYCQTMLLVAACLKCGNTGCFSARKIFACILMTSLRVGVETSSFLHSRFLKLIEMQNYFEKVSISTVLLLYKLSYIHTCIMLSL